MRVSTNNMFNEGIARISSVQNQQIKLQEQLSTGKKFTSPKDAPIEAARALEISYLKEVNSNYANVRKTAETSLSVLEGNLDSVTNNILSAQSKLVASGNGALSDNEREFLASDLRNILEGLVGLANTQDASGKYLYSGYQTSTQAYQYNAGTSSYDYQGSTGKNIAIEVAPNVDMEVTFDGQQVFQNGTDIFAELQDMITLLETPVTNATEAAALNAGREQAIGAMKAGLDNVLNVRATVGGRLNQIEELNKSGEALDVQYATSLSDIQDLDYAKALSEYSKTEVMLEAAQKTFTSTVKLSLFNYL